MPINWTPEKKREYAKKRYYRLKKLGKGSSKRSKNNDVKHSTEHVDLIHTSKKIAISNTLPDSTRIELTGNPFVDTGLAVIASKCSLASIEELNLGHLRTVHEDGKRLAKDVQKLKSFTMIFTRNSLLTQYPKVDPNGIREKRIKMHAAITCELLNSIGLETENDCCQSCGNEKSVDLSEIVNSALKKFGEEPKERFVGRDWFPMAGSMGSDAQALPSGSKAPSLCAKCLFAVQYLPLGVRLFGKELAVFQSTTTQFWYELVRDIERLIRKQIQDGIADILGSKQGRSGLANQLMSLFNELQRSKKTTSLDKNTKLYVWRFANSTAPNLEIENIPSHALEFLYEASTKWSLSSEITSIMNRERVPESRTFFSCVMARKDYFGLYPGKLGKDKEYQGASHYLFYFYQTCILGRSSSSLKAACEVARAGLEIFEKERNVQRETSSTKNKGKHRNKDLERLTRVEAFRERKTKAMFSRIMADLARKGRFTQSVYIEFFPYIGDGVSVSQDGWNLIRYYFGAIVRDKEIEFFDGTSVSNVVSESPVSRKIVDTALKIFQEHMSVRSPQRFENDVLKRLERQRLGADWLRIQFVKLARKCEGFNYDDWNYLCHPWELHWTLFELYFQFRLLWSEWLQNPPSFATSEENQSDDSITNVMNASGIPNGIAQKLIYIMSEYAERRSWERVDKDILLRLQRREIGIGWFISKLVREIDSPVTEDEMDQFLHGPDGSLRISERTFQLSLFLNNVYRVMRQQMQLQSLVVAVN